MKQKIMLNNGCTAKLQIWDTAGQEKYQSLSSQFYRGSDVCLIVFDLTDEYTFERIEFWRQNFLRYASIRTPIIIIGNKSDMAT